MREFPCASGKRRGGKGENEKQTFWGKGERGREEWGRMGNRWVSRAMIAGLILPNEYVYSHFFTSAIKLQIF